MPYYIDSALPCLVLKQQRYVYIILISTDWESLRHMYHQFVLVYII